MHALFVREHNRLAAEIAASSPELTGEEIDQEPRRFVGALMQSITYDEFLPALLGANVLTPYRGYRWTVSPAINNEFSTAIFRFGHSAASVGSCGRRRYRSLGGHPFGGARGTRWRAGVQSDQPSVHGVAGW